MARNLYENAHPGALKEIKALVEGTIAGDRIKKEYLLERLGTTDGVFAFANLTNVYLQKNYANSFADAIWPKLSEQSIVQDFRTISWLSFAPDMSTEKAANKGVARAAAGVYGGTLPEVAEGEKYQSFNLTQNLVSGFSVKKYGAQIGFTWEAFVNDPYNTVRRIPSIMAFSAQNTMDDNVTRALYTAANARPHLAATAAPQNGLAQLNADSALSYSALLLAQQQLALTKDAFGNYVTFGELALSIDPSLVPTAEWILKQSSLTTRVTTGSGNNNYTETQSSYSLGNITIVPNRYLAYYTGNTTAWILSPLAGNGSPAEPAIVTAFLAGEEAPEVRVSGLAGYTPNGAALPFTSGSFDTDTFDMRVRQVGGAGAVNAYPLIMSNGTGALI